MKTKLICLLMSLITCLSLASCGLSDIVAVRGVGREAPDTNASEPSVSASGESREPYGRSCLTPHQKELYDMIGSAYGNGDIVFEEPEEYHDVYRALFFYELDVLDSTNIFGGYYYDIPDYTIHIDDEFITAHPEYDTYSYNTTLRAYRKNSGGVCDLLPGSTPVSSLDTRWYENERFSESDLLQMRKEFTAVEQEWLSRLPGEDASEYDRVYELAMLMCEEITYAETEFGNTPYNIVKGELFCEGYAYTFAYFARKIGIEAIVVTGTYNDIGHGWNMVRIGDNWYHIDVTWMDNESSMPDMIHFLRSEAEAVKSGHSDLVLGDLLEYSSEEDHGDYPLPDALVDFDLTTEYDDSCRIFSFEITDDLGENRTLGMSLPSNVSTHQEEAVWDTNGQVTLMRFYPAGRYYFGTGYIFTKPFAAEADRTTEDLFKEAFGVSYQPTHTEFLSGHTSSGLEWSAAVQDLTYENEECWGLTFLIRLSETETVQGYISEIGDGAEETVRQALDSLSIEKA